MKKVLLFFLLSICFISKISYCEENPHSIESFYKTYKDKREIPQAFVIGYAQAVRLGFINGIYYTTSTRNKELEDCFFDVKMELIVDGVFRDLQDGVYEPKGFFAIAVVDKMIKYCANKIKNNQSK